MHIFDSQTDTQLLSQATLYFFHIFHNMHFISFLYRKATFHLQGILSFLFLHFIIEKVNFLFLVPAFILKAIHVTTNRCWSPKDDSRWVKCRCIWFDTHL